MNNRLDNIKKVKSRSTLSKKPPKSAIPENTDNPEKLSENDQLLIQALPSSIQWKA